MSQASKDEKLRAGYADLLNRRIKRVTAMSEIAALAKKQVTTEDLKHHVNIVIELIRLDADHELYHRWSTSYKSGDLVWVAGTHGHEGLLNDGNVLFHDLEIMNLLRQLAASKEIP